MDNSYTPFSSTTTTTTATTNATQLGHPNMGLPQNHSEFSIPQPMNLTNFSTSSAPLSTPSNSHQFQQYYSPLFAPPYQTLQFPYPHSYPFAYPAVQPFFQAQSGVEFGVSSPVPGSSFMQPPVDGLSTSKIARIKRKLARQRSLSLQRSASLAAGTASQVDARRLASSVANNSDAKKDLYNFCTPDNKKLRVLLKKELKNSDVGTLGRIVLPKRETEANLPTLSDKEGIQLMIRDVYSNQMWTLKFKFWSNNKSRMYVLENTGDFVRKNGLETGDSLTLYEDESKNLYFTITKVEKIAAEPSNINNNYDNGNYANSNVNNATTNNGNMYMPSPFQSRDEEETSLQLLIQQLQHKEPQETNTLMSLPMDTAADCPRLPEEASSAAATSSMSGRGKATSLDDIQFNFDDCFGSLDMLPDDIDHYNFSP